MNTPVQGSAADLIKQAMIDLHRELTSRGMRSRLILQIHDELLLEVPEAEAEKAEALVTEVMEGREAGRAARGRRPTRPELGRGPLTSPGERLRPGPRVLGSLEVLKCRSTSTSAKDGTFELVRKFSDVPLGLPDLRGR